MYNTLYVELGKLFRELRHSYNMSQQYVADRLGVTRACYANWEQGRRIIDFEMFLKICDVYNADPNEISNKVRKYIYKK